MHLMAHGGAEANGWDMSVADWRGAQFTLCSIVIGDTQLVHTFFARAFAQIRSFAYARAKKVRTNFWLLLFFSDVMTVLFCAQMRRCTKNCSVSTQPDSHYRRIDHLVVKN